MSSFGLATMTHGTHMDALWEAYNRFVAERASVREAIKALKYKWFGMWIKGGARKLWRVEKMWERRSVRKREAAGVVPWSGCSCEHGGVFAGLQAKPGLNTEQFHASAAEKSTGKLEANK